MGAGWGGLQRRVGVV